MELEGLPEDLCIELEALQHQLDQSSLEIQRQGSHVTATASLEPRLGWGNDVQVQFALCTLRVALDASTYPETLPSISLRDVKGLDDHRQAQLLQHLQHEAQQLQGSMMLGHLFECAAGWLTDNNTPTGDCAFCLAPMEASSQGEARALTRLPCFHAFHSACYVPWWAWQQQDCAAKERDLIAHTGAKAAAAIAADKLPPREPPPQEHLYACSCPVCRTPSPLLQLPEHLVQQLQSALDSHSHTPPQTDTSGQSQTEPAEQGSEVASDTNTVSQWQGVDVEQLRQVQRTHRKQWQQQVDVGGLIGTGGRAGRVSDPSSVVTGSGGGARDVGTVSTADGRGTAGREVPQPPVAGSPNKQARGPRSSGGGAGGGGGGGGGGATQGRASGSQFAPKAVYGHQPSGRGRPDGQGHRGGQEHEGNGGLVRAPSDKHTSTSGRGGRGHGRGQAARVADKRSTQDTGVVTIDRPRDGEVQEPAGRRGRGGGRGGEGGLGRGGRGMSRGAGRPLGNSSFVTEGHRALDAMMGEGLGAARDTVL